MSNQNENKVTDHLTHGYDQLLEKLNEWSEKSDESTGPLLMQGLEDAAKLLSEMGQWTKEEIDLLSLYVKRDLHHTAQKLQENNNKLIEWLDLDIKIIEDKLLTVFSDMADQTRIELDKLHHLAETADDLHTGEVTSLGVISCKSCGKEMHFHKSGRIPPCPSCHKTVFVRK
ncbi:MAG: zinc ribbon-containing protein [Gammaproteobacteria bacterium]|nr:zinc ribbon-containing protein [Gammaproteobacteria bacterium]